jgi:hypothetical protein
MCASAWCDQCSQSCVMCEEVNPTPQKNSSPTPHFSSMAQVARGVGGVDVGAPQVDRSIDVFGWDVALLSICIQLFSEP